MNIRKVIKAVCVVVGLAVCGGALWLASLKPTGKADWDAPFMRMPIATFAADGKTVTIENIRDFHFRTEWDYDIRYRTEKYDLDAIESMDYSVTHWNGHELFGHILLSFKFRDGRRLVFSPEARMTKGHVYELLPGFFRQYELIFICATEEDAIQLRTHHRRYEQSEVFLYPTVTTPEQAKVLLTDLLNRANVLRDHPEFYNGLFYNCLSTMESSMKKIGVDFCDPLHGLVNGLSDRWGWESGWLRKDRPDESFEDYHRRHSVNQYVEHLVDPPDYSQRIRPGR